MARARSLDSLQPNPSVQFRQGVSRIADNDGAFESLIERRRVRDGLVIALPCGRLRERRLFHHFAALAMVWSST
jgi:hypothetical protein